MMALPYDQEGNWLETPILVESVGMPETPAFELGEDAEYQQYLFSLEELQALGATLQSVGGINRGYAEEAHAILPEFAAKFPLGFFTKHTSRTQYRVSVEHIFSSAWEFVVKMIKKLQAMLRRFVNWILGKDVSDDTPPSKAEAKQATEQVVKRERKYMELSSRTQTVQIDMKKLTKVVQKNPYIYQAPDGKLVYLQSFDQACEVILSERDAPVRFHSAFYQVDPQWLDMVERGPWSSLVLSVAAQIRPSFAIMGERNLALTKVLARINQGGWSVHDIEGIKGLTSSYEAALPHGAASYTQLSRQLMQLTLEMKNGPEARERAPEFRSFAVAAQTIISTPPVQHLIAELKNGIEEMHLLTEVVDDFSTAVTKFMTAEAPSEILDVISQALHFLREESQALIYIVQSMQDYFTKLIDFGDVVVRGSFYVIQKLEKHVKNRGAQSQSSDVTKAIQEIYAQHQKFD